MRGYCDCAFNFIVTLCFVQLLFMIESRDLALYKERSIIIIASGDKVFMLQGRVACATQWKVKCSNWKRWYHGVNTVV